MVQPPRSDISGAECRSLIIPNPLIRNHTFSRTCFFGPEASVPGTQSSIFSTNSRLFRSTLSKSFLPLPEYYNNFRQLTGARPPSLQDCLQAVCVEHRGPTQKTGLDHDRQSLDHIERCHPWSLWGPP